MNVNRQEIMEEMMGWGECGCCGGTGKEVGQGWMNRAVEGMVGEGKKFRSYGEMARWLGITPGYLAMLRKGKRKWGREHLDKVLVGMGVEGGFEGLKGGDGVG